MMMRMESVKQMQRHFSLALSILLAVLLPLALVSVFLFASAGATATPLLSDPRQDKFLAAIQASDKDYMRHAESGILLKVIKKGTSEWSATGTTPLTCHFTGMFPNYREGKPGRVFESSDPDQPLKFRPIDVLKCWSIAVQLVPIGSKVQMVCPYHVAYGKRGLLPDVPARTPLVFTMEILHGETSNAAGHQLVKSVDEMKEHFSSAMGRSWDSVEEAAVSA